jgi:hypothetical protein
MNKTSNQRLPIPTANIFFFLISVLSIKNSDYFFSSTYVIHFPFLICLITGVRIIGAFAVVFSVAPLKVNRSMRNG